MAADPPCPAWTRPGRPGLAAVTALPALSALQGKSGHCEMMTPRQGMLALDDWITAVDA